MTGYRILNSVLSVPSFCHLPGSIVPVGLLFSTPHSGPPFFFFFLFVQQAIVESHPDKEEEAGDDKKDSTALVCVLVIMIDVFKLPCEKATLHISEWMSYTNHK